MAQRERDEELRTHLREIERACRGRTEGGRVASYIPELANVDPNLFSISVVRMDGTAASAGDCAVPFSMQSISKVAALAFACERFGRDDVFRHVGMEPCAEPFNSIMKLEIASNIPLNPFINSGAITIAAMLKNRLAEGALDGFLRFAARMAGRPDDAPLAVDERVYASEAATADRNRALGYFMHSTGALQCGVEEALELYFKMCSTEATTEDLAAIGAAIAGGGVLPGSGERVFSLETAHTLIGLMSTCGLYNESGEFAVRVGIPAKSGVCGGILCAVPGRMGTAVFSPPLDERGNSVVGVRALTMLSDRLRLRGV